MVLVKFTLNGRYIEANVEPNEILLNTLRNKLGIKSVKRGCERGECGACTILLDGKPVYSCMLLTVQVDGHSINTVDSLWNNELFKKLVYNFTIKGAIQCGYCSPGFLITAYALLRTRKAISREGILKAIEGNLCRCTGYKKIIEAIMETYKCIQTKNSG
ncbi:MAG: (2Fe-2S)-binding protein [Thermoprotei archaeon]|nr:MAG: (2Fe-2S)-binding protein [Thermoprotei archaeon]